MAHVLIKRRLVSIILAHKISCNVCYNGYGNQLLEWEIRVVGVHTKRSNWEIKSTLLMYQYTGLKYTSYVLNYQPSCMSHILFSERFLWQWIGTVLIFHAAVDNMIHYCDSTQINTAVSVLFSVSFDNLIDLSLVRTCINKKYNLPKDMLTFKYPSY